VFHAALPALRRTVETVLGQECAELEYWIVDGASTDGTPAYLAELAARGVRSAIIERAKRLLRSPGISVLPEAEIACEVGTVHAMHDPTEGGIVGALWEMAAAAGTGFRVEEARIPVRPATAAICGALGVDPLRLIASGALLVACPDGAAMVRGLGERGVPATVIGEVTAGPCELVRPDGRVTVVETVGRDELYRLLEEPGPGS
jgi:hydrogenase maturation factor